MEWLFSPCVCLRILSLPQKSKWAKDSQSGFWPKHVHQNPQTQHINLQVCFVMQEMSTWAQSSSGLMHERNLHIAANGEPSEDWDNLSSPWRFTIASIEPDTQATIRGVRSCLVWFCPFLAYVSTAELCCITGKEFVEWLWNKTYISWVRFNIGPPVSRVPHKLLSLTDFVRWSPTLEKTSWTWSKTRTSCCNAVVLEATKQTKHACLSGCQMCGLHKTKPSFGLVWLNASPPCHFDWSREDFYRGISFTFPMLMALCACLEPFRRPLTHAFLFHVMCWFWSHFPPVRQTRKLRPASHHSWNRFFLSVPLPLVVVLVLILECVSAELEITFNFSSQGRRGKYSY